jgi:hypothetical protein
MYSAASTLAAVFAIFGLAGCGALDRVFDPVGDPGRVIALEPKFPELEPGQSVELAARVVGEEGRSFQFSFEEDSGGQVVELTPRNGSHVQVTAVGPGQAFVTAKLDGDEGLAVVTVVARP